MNEAEDKLIPLAEMAKKVGLSEQSLRRRTIYGQKGVSGNPVFLERRLTIHGWSTCQRWMKEFEDRLNNPYYKPDSTSTSAITDGDR